MSGMAALLKALGPKAAMLKGIGGVGADIAKQVGREGMNVAGGLKNAGSGMVRELGKVNLGGDKRALMQILKNNKLGAAALGGGAALGAGGAGLAAHEMMEDEGEEEDEGKMALLKKLGLA